MNLQEVNNITMTEGTVRTIHDSNGKLLWGKLTYSTTYDGDTEQDGTPTPSSPVDVDVVTGTQTVRINGKNCLPYPYDGTGNGRGVTFSADSSGIITMNGQNDDTGQSQFFVYDYHRHSDKPYIIPAGTYYLIKPSNNDVSVVFYDGVTYRTLRMNSDSMTLEKDTEFLQIYFTVNKGNTTVFSDFEVYPMLSTMPNQTKDDFEPYQAGSYTVNLGATELCKIDTYQDYIYKSGDDWYIHKEISNTTFTGDATESWDLYISGQVFRTRILDMKGEDNQNVIVPLYCYYYEPDTYSHLTASSATKPDYGIAGRASVTSGIAIRNKDCEDVTSFKTWLSTHNTTVYYALATATDTQITDTTLINQLNSIHQFLTRYGYTGTVSGSLPFVITQTTLC